MAGKPPRAVDRQDCASRAALPWPAGRTQPTGDPRLAAQMVAVGVQGVADGRSSTPSGHSGASLNWRDFCAANDEPEETGKLDVRAINPLAA